MCNQSSSHAGAAGEKRTAQPQGRQQISANVDVTLTNNRLILLRHGETEWSATGRHTGRTDIELTDTGRHQAKLAAEVLAELHMRDPLVISSPRARALATAELAGLTVNAVSSLLSEWDYGDYEGLTTPQIRETVPDWTVWTHPCPGGETTGEVTARADDAITWALDAMQERDVVFVGHGHFSRVMLTRWIEHPIRDGIRFSMGAASIAVCGFEHRVRQLSALGLAGHPNPGHQH